MRLDGQTVVDAPVERLWEVLNDVELLRKHMPGCESLTEVGPGAYEAVLSIGVAAIKGRYTAKLHMVDADPPHGYTLCVEGSGKPGFVKGEGQVRLAPTEGGTELTYSGDLQIGGMIARVGQRLISGLAQRMTRQFFDELAAEAGGAVTP
jgi:hypothetical protein